jgi:imidazolonepropionase-like amidohydrolase
MLVFENCLLIDGIAAEALPGRHVLINEGRIAEVSDRPIAACAAERIDLRGKTLMPGLIDAHVHVYAIHLNQHLTRDMPHTLMTAHAVPRLRGMLLRGFTTVRDVAGGDWGIKEAVAKRLVEGPRLFVSGRALSQTGGHGDHRYRTEDSVPCACTSALDMLTRVADGVDGVRAAARDELRKGADHLKIMVSGGVGSPHDDISHHQYSREEIAAAVEEATARGTYVAAHAYGASSIKRAVESGVRTIEHGNLIDGPTAKVVAERGAYVVPTLICYEQTAQNAEHYGLSAEIQRKLRIVNEAGIAMLDICRSAGIRMGFGTDLMGELISAQTHELALRARVLPPMDIIRSATAVNAEILGQAGRLGQVVTGAHADLLVVDGDPSRDISLLDERKGAVSAVIQAGRFITRRI